jgi:EAL domain-containing protein (putative c-di-GMP-specific phosphodiesterase class I)
VIPIGWWVLKEACTRFRAWQDEAAGHTLSISVNVSGRQLRQPDFLQRVRTIIEETGIDPASLKLELTESAIIDDPDSAQALLGKLKELKVRLAIDDFGTGYSSLSYLHRFPIDTLKIDRTFVSQIASAGKNLEICRTITTLARNLGMDVVAEGVETEEQRKQLEALGCEHGQGYLFHKPMPQAAIDELVAASALW